MKDQLEIGWLLVERLDNNPKTRRKLLARGFTAERRGNLFSQYAWNAACEIAGVSVTAPETQEDTATAGYVQAQEDALQDQQAALCGC